MAPARTSPHFRTHRRQRRDQRSVGEFSAAVFGTGDVCPSHWKHFLPSPLIRSRNECAIRMSFRSPLTYGSRTWSFSAIIASSVSMIFLASFPAASDFMNLEQSHSEVIGWGGRDAIAVSERCAQSSSRVVVTCRRSSPDGPDHHTRISRPTMSLKSAAFMVTNVARCTSACAAIIRSGSFRRE